MSFKLIRKADVVLIIILIIICACLFLPRLFADKKLSATVYQNGETVETVDLSSVGKSYELRLDGAVILVEKNAISFLGANCPDKLCVKCGRLTHAGDTAVCVPTATVITVSGDKNEIDALSY